MNGNTIKDSEEKYKILTSLLPEMVFETDLSKQLTFINLKAMEVFGYGSDIYINKINFLDLISKEDRRRCSEDIKHVIANRNLPSGIEYKAITKEGRKFPVSLYVTKMGSNNEFFGLNILMFDKTMQKTAEQNSLNYQENMTFLSKSALNFLTLPSDDDIFIFVGKSLSKFASNSIIIVFSYDHRRNISNIRFISRIYPYINELVNILGKSPEDFDIELSEKFISNYLSDKSLRKIDDGLTEVLAHKLSKEKINKIQKLLKVDNFYSIGMMRENTLYGGLLIANSAKTETIDSQTIETFIYQAGIALHRKQIDNELVKAKIIAEESDRLKSSFLANMSHELRTPLNGILGLTQVMLKSDNDNNDFQTNVKIISDSANTLLTLIEDIMDVSRLEAEQLKIKPRPFVLNNLMDQLYSIFMVNPILKQQNEKQQKIVLKLDKPKDNIAIISDPDRIKQIFVNLLTNALKFTQEGYVNYGYTIENEMILFYVKDSGIGIPKSKTETIFERFHQVDNSLSRKYRGSGLGLAISKGLTTLLNGEIWCESDLGKGSNFYFTIPYQPTKMPENNDLPEKKYATAYDWHDYTALIVEDDLINFKVIEAMLRKTHVNIIHADTGFKAIEKINLNKHIDIVLMDVHLPEMNGIEATSRILEINPALPIIAQTANAFSDDKDKCIEAGCVDYISKPIIMDALFGKMAKFLPGSNK